jgi:hypothetical protein
MKNSNYSFPKLLAIGFIIVCTGIAWALLGAALVHRTDQAALTLSTAVQNGWGGPLAQAHPWAWYESPTGKDGRKRINPESSQVTVRLLSNPKQKGLLWFRTFDVAFAGVYEITNPTPIEQMIYVSFELPHNTGGCYDVSFVLGDRTDRLLEEARAKENRFQLLATKPFVRRTLSDVTGKKNWHRWRGGSARAQ